MGGKGSGGEEGWRGRGNHVLDVFVIFSFLSEFGVEK